MQSHLNLPRIGPARRFIAPITATAGPVTQLVDIVESVGVDALIRAIDAGLPVYDAGAALMARRAELDMLREIIGEGAR